MRNYYEAAMTQAPKEPGIERIVSGAITADGRKVSEGPLLLGLMGVAVVAVGLMAFTGKK